MFYKYKKKFKKARELKLDISSKERIKYNLSNYIQENQAPEKTAKPDSRPVFADQYKFKYRLVSIFAVLLITLSTGTGIAAQKALPGDTLYAVKTQVNEKVKGFLQFDVKAKSNHQASLIEERFREYVKLASQGRLDSDNQSTLDNLINLELVHLEKYLSGVYGAKTSAMQIDLYNQLLAHKVVIESLIVNFENTEKLSSIIAQIQIIESKLWPSLKLISSEEENEKIEEEATKAIKRVKDEISQKENTLHQKAIEQIKLELELSQNSLREGSILNMRGEHETARETLRNAERSAIRAEKLLEIHEDLKIKDQVESGRLVEKIGGIVEGVANIFQKGNDDGEKAGNAAKDLNTPGL